MSPALLATVALLAAPPMPGEAEARRFTDAFERAEALYSKGDYGAAIALFRDADRLKVTPEVAFDLARCFEKLGDRAFTTLYDRLSVARAPDAEDASDIVNRVGRTLANEEDEGRTLLEVFSPGALSLSVAGRHFPAAPAALFLPPGEYVVEGEFPSGRKRLSVQVALGQVKSVWFEPVRPPLVPAPGPVQEAAVAVEAPAKPSPPTSGTRVAAFVALGAGALALGAGATLGALSSGDAVRAQDKALTVREALAAAEAANGKATAANVLFVAGGLLAVTGGALFVFSLPSPGEPAGGAQ